MARVRVKQVGGIGSGQTARQGQGVMCREKAQRLVGLAGDQIVQIGMNGAQCQVGGGYRLAIGAALFDGQ